MRESIPDMIQMYSQLKHFKGLTNKHNTLYDYCGLMFENVHG